MNQAEKASEEAKKKAADAEEPAEPEDVDQDAGAGAKHDEAADQPEASAGDPGEVPSLFSEEEDEPEAAGDAEPEPAEARVEAEAVEEEAEAEAVEEEEPGPVDEEPEPEPEPEPAEAEPAEAEPDETPSLLPEREEEAAAAKDEAVEATAEPARTAEAEAEVEEPPAVPEGDQPTIFAIKTTINQENSVGEIIANKAKKQGVKVLSILHPAEIRGYLFVEAMDRVPLEEMVRGIPHMRGVVKGETDLKEVQHFLTPKPSVEGIAEGDIVELISGPFKGEKARVQRIDEAKEEITVELFEAMVPIPVTVSGDAVRVLEKRGS